MRNQVGKRMLIIFAALIVLVVVIAVSCAFGAADISPLTILKMIASRVPLFGGAVHRDWSEGIETIIFRIRLPRILLAAVVGAGLANAGATFQALFRNSMADPFIIGVSSGAAVGAAMASFLGLGSRLFGLDSTPLLAFAGSLLTVSVVYGLAKRGNNLRTNDLLLAGVAVSSFGSSIVSLLMVFSSGNLDHIVFWLMGGLSGRGWDQLMVCLPYIIIASLIVFAMSKKLNVMLLGEDTAQNLGVDVERLKIILLVAGSLIAAAAVSVTGIIGFVGLIVPHITRLLIGSDHRYLLPASAVFGAIFLVASDAIARIALAPMELPVGIVTSLFGAPFFLYLLRRK